MNQTAEITASVPLAGPPASQNNERGRTHGLSFIFWLLEQNIWVLLAFPTLVSVVVGAATNMNWLAMLLAWLAVPLFGVILPLLYLVYLSYQHDAGAVDWRGLITWRNEADANAWFGKKIPMEVLYEAYMAEKLDFVGDVY
jgi:hypothetical protein